MSVAAASQSSSPAIPGTVRETLLWRRKKLSLGVLLLSTAAWAALQIYGFNFITIVSWVAIALFTLLFLWANIHRLLSKDAPDLSWLQIPEHSSQDMAKFSREWAEETVRWMFHVSAENDCYIFAATVAGLLVLSFVGSIVEFPTILYAGIVISMTVPATYLTYEEQMRRSWERVKAQWRRLWSIVHEKVFVRVKNKLPHYDQKQKKEE